MSEAQRLLRDLIQESGFAAHLRQRAAQVGGTIVLPEADDPRVLAAAIALRELGIARPVLLGSTGAVLRELANEGVDPGAFEIVDPAHDERATHFAEALFERRRKKGLTQGEARVVARQPLQFGAAMVGHSIAHAMVAGAAHPTGDVIRAGLYQVGLAEGISVVSGSFLLVGESFDRPLLFADAAVLPTPDEDQLVAIGRSAAATFQALVERTPRIACLSFSTKGSADHPSARRMASVAQRLAQLGYQADGELQLDAALVASVAARKAPDSAVAGHADVLLFPDLNAANIGYKLAERLGGLDAMGPILQGLRRPVFDLSRGCSAADIVNTAAIALLNAGGESK